MLLWGPIGTQNSCLWPCLFFISEKSIWMNRHPPDFIFNLRMPCDGGACFPVFVSHADQQFNSAVKSSDWWGDIITLTKKLPQYFDVCPEDRIHHAPWFLHSTTTQYVEKNTGSWRQMSKAHVTLCIIPCEKISTLMHTFKIIYIFLII